MSEELKTRSAALNASIEPLRVGLHTFGCRSNYADSVDLQSALTAQGAFTCAVDEPADVYVLNTCTVTDSADRDVLRMIRKLQRQRPDSRIVITGCMAEVKAEELIGESKVAAVVGPGRRDELVAEIFEQGGALSGANFLPEITKGAAVHPSGRRVKKSLPERRSIFMNQEMPGGLPGPGQAMGSLHTRARFHLRVQEGCENSCTFCIIPTTRGRLSSREIHKVLSDIESLAELGYCEVVLSGTHLGGWGEDIGQELFTLLDALGKHSAIPRIRLSSIDPNDLTEKSIDCLVKYPVFCNHLHICFQAFTDRTLKRMNRKYRLKEAVELVEYVAAALPGCGIGSDVIAGFPGESREELEEGMELFLHLPISYLHVFPYSERSGTAAVRLDGTIDPLERKRRASRWRAIAQRKNDAFLSGLVGQTLEIVRESDGDDRFVGTSREFAPCVVEGVPAKVVDVGSLALVRATAFNSESGEVLCELLNPENLVSAQ